MRFSAGSSTGSSAGVAPPGEDSGHAHVAHAHTCLTPRRTVAGRGGDGLGEPYSTMNLGVNQAGAREVPVPSSSTFSRSTSLIAGPR